MTLRRDLRNRRASGRKRAERSEAAPPLLTAGDRSECSEASEASRCTLLVEIRTVPRFSRSPTQTPGKSRFWCACHSGTDKPALAVSRLKNEPARPPCRLDWVRASTRYCGRWRCAGSTVSVSGSIRFSRIHHLAEPTLYVEWRHSARPALPLKLPGSAPGVTPVRGVPPFTWLGPTTLGRDLATPHTAGVDGAAPSWGITQGHDLTS